LIQNDVKKVLNHTLKKQIKLLLDQFDTIYTFLWTTLYVKSLNNYFIS